jgi:G3E family GTPase
MGKDPGPVDISRTKGLIRLVDGREYVLQGVTDVFELKQVLSEGDKGVEEGGKIVFIGKGVHDSLRQDLIKAIDR